MRITKDVDLPEQLLEALRDGRLVVFAGAGVSMDPPAQLPGFRQLAERLANDAVKRPPGPEESLDEFLEALEAQGVNVHQRIREIYGDASSQPNQIHHDLLRLFQDADRVRIVTTNFDPHFTSAANTAYGDNAVEVFRAGALPPGYDFAGIVYLHGCVDRSSSRLVVTARDFGEAYMTERWAANFLVRMFDEWTVLFVGYSHDDVLMKYLSRALGGRTKPRYVLTHRDAAQWHQFGITAIAYAKQEDPPEHDQMNEAIARWARHANMGLLDHEKRIKEIVERPPPEDPVDEDYIKDALKDEACTRIFTKNVRDVKWLRWIEELPQFQVRFKPEVQIDELSRWLAHWFAEEYVVGHTEDALATYMRRGQTPHAELVFAILFRFHRDPRPDGTTFRRWLAVLLGGPTPPPYSDYFDYALTHCVWPDDREIALLLFEYLTTPKVRLKPSFAELLGGSAQVTVDLQSTGDEHWIRHGWENLFRPNLADCAADIARVVAHQVEQAARLYRTASA